MTTEHLHARHPTPSSNGFAAPRVTLVSVIQMIESGRAASDLAQQLHAVEKAIAIAKKTLIDDHIDHCLNNSVEDGRTKNPSSNSKKSRSTCRRSARRNDAVSIIEALLRIWLSMLIGCVACTPAFAEQAPSFPDLLRQAERTSPRLPELAATCSRPRDTHDRRRRGRRRASRSSARTSAAAASIAARAQAQTTLSISEPIEIGGQRGARIGGQANAAIAARKLAERRGASSSATSSRSHTPHAEAGAARIALLTEDLERAREDVRSARALVDAGKEGELRAVQADAAAAAAQADLEAAKADAVAALSRLRRSSESQMLTIPCGRRCCGAARSPGSGDVDLLRTPL